MLGKRGRPPFRRTTSMTGISVNLGNIEAAPLPPPPGAPTEMIGGEYQHILSPRYVRKDPSAVESHLETSDFLRSCGLCHRRLTPGRDIYMYRGDTAFCSLECRQQQMKQDERKKRSAAAAAKNGESHRSEMASTTHKTSGNTGNVVAA